jgi:hypothetical protein
MRLLSRLQASILATVRVSRLSSLCNPDNWDILNHVYKEVFGCKFTAAILTVHTITRVCAAPHPLPCMRARVLVLLSADQSIGQWHIVRLPTAAQPEHPEEARDILPNLRSSQAWKSACLTLAQVLVVGSGWRMDTQTVPYCGDKERRMLNITACEAIGFTALTTERREYSA